MAASTSSQPPMVTGEADESAEAMIPPAKRIHVDESNDKWMDEIDYEIEKHKVGKLLLCRPCACTLPSRSIGFTNCM